MSDDWQCEPPIGQPSVCPCIPGHDTSPPQREAWWVWKSFGNDDSSRTNLTFTPIRFVVISSSQLIHEYRMRCSTDTRVRFDYPVGSHGPASLDRLLFSAPGKRIVPYEWRASFFTLSCCAACFGVGENISRSKVTASSILTLAGTIVRM